jgi:hypothetical protein
VFGEGVEEENDAEKLQQLTWKSKIAATMT